TTTVYDAAGRTVAAVNPLAQRTTTVYDGAGRARAGIDPLNNRTSTTYDPVGRAIAATDALGNRTTTVYDVAGRALTRIDPLGNRTSSVYDRASRVIAAINALGRRTTTTFDAASRVVAHIDPLVNRTSTVYDAANRVVAQINPLSFRTTTVYDAAGRTVAAIDPLANRTTTVYDAASRVRVSINGLGGRTTSLYDAASRVVAAIDPLTNRTTTVYDAASRPLATINALGLRSSTVYDAAGRGVAAIDPRGNRTTTVYDAAGRTVASIDALGNRTTSVYDAAGRPLVAVNPLGFRTTTAYLATGSVRTVTDPLGKRTTYSYDAANRQIAATDPLANRTTTLYDATSAVRGTIDPLSRRTTTLYDLASRPVARIDALANRTTTIYDAAGRRVATANALGNRTSNSYDAAGRRTRMTDANGKRVTFLFDALARDLGSIDPLGRRVTMGYDAAGNRTLKLDPRGVRLTQVYDAGYRLTGERYSTGRRHTYAYDAANNRTRAADPTGRYTTTYDALNRVAVTANALAKRVTYAYDAGGRRSRLIDPDGGRFTYSHDAADRLTVVLNPQGKRTSFSYDATGRQTLQRHGNGALTTQAYDAAGQLTRLINASGAGVVVSRFTYLYDQAGNRRAVLEAYGDRTTWTYDAAYQLRNEQRGGTNALNVTHAYDPAGNRLAQTDSGTRTSYVYDAANQLLTEQTGAARTTYLYDPCGNRTQKTALAALTTYRWDETGRLSQAAPLTAPVTLAYNTDGRRVSKTVGAQVRQFLYDFEKVLQEADGTGATTKEYTASEQPYGDLVSAYATAGGGQTTYHEYDGLGSTDALVNDAQTALDRYRYRAFGLANHTQGTGSTDFDYVGRQMYFRDPEVDLYFVRARYYDALTARFISEDPSGYRPGEPNLYRYCANNPVNQTDPSGLEGCPPTDVYMTANVARSNFIGKYVGWLSPDAALALDRVTDPKNLNLAKNVVLENTAGRILDEQTLSQLKAGTDPEALVKVSVQAGCLLEVQAKNIYAAGKESVAWAYDQTGRAVAYAGMRVIESTSAAAEKFAGFAKDLAGPLADVWKLVEDLINQFMVGADLVKTIFNEPERVKTNLIEGLDKGFHTFFDKDKIWDNLKEVFFAWLFGPIAERFKGWKPPTELTWQALLDVVQRGLGLTLDMVLSVIKSAIQTVFNVSVDNVVNVIIQVQEIYGAFFDENGEFSPAHAWAALLDKAKEVFDWGGLAVLFAKQLAVWAAQTAAVKVAEWLSNLIAPGVSVLPLIVNGIRWLVTEGGKVVEFIKKILAFVKEIIAVDASDKVAGIVVGLIKDALKTLLNLVFQVVVGINPPMFIMETLDKVYSTVWGWIKQAIINLLKWLYDKVRKVLGLDPSKNMGAGCPTMPGGKPAGGKCFTAGVRFWSGRGELLAIEEEHLGRRAWTLSEAERQGAAPPLEATLDPVTLRRVGFQMESGPDDALDGALLRSIEWLAANGANVGAKFSLDLPEVGVRGWAQVISVGLCPAIEEGPGRVVTGWFKHRRGWAHDLRVEQEGQPIGVTASHPFWSVDRQDWVSAGELDFGERLQGQCKVVRARSFLARSEAEPVFNLEVDGDHCYRVGEQGLLVHNQSAPVAATPAPCCPPPDTLPSSATLGTNLGSGADADVKSTTVSNQPEAHHIVAGAAATAAG
ncbi:MAG TPA: RHS repeat-associated core domain-containing protein, partial [Gemmataceae bacterium]|nr:RHS repeat-associated core domain-containing protein [Gemmataceae bacterium]